MNQRKMAKKSVHPAFNSFGGFFAIGQVYNDSGVSFIGRKDFNVRVILKVWRSLSQFPINSQNFQSDMKASIGIS